MKVRPEATRVGETGMRWGESGLPVGPVFWDGGGACLASKVPLREEEEDHLRAIDVALQRADILQIINLSAPRGRGK